MSNTETSVALSLAELARIEEKRIEREQAERARERAARAKAERDSEARRREEEEQRQRASAAERAQRESAEAVERARREARERAAADVARIEAEARARLEADNAARAHELTTLRVQRETGRRRRELGLGVALAITLALGGFGAFEASVRATAKDTAIAELRERERALLRERDDSKRVEVGSLDRRHASLLARPRAADAKAQRATADAARAALDPSAPSRDRLRAFSESLDALESRVGTLDRLADLERRHADLSAWAAATKREKGLVAVKAAALRAKSPSAGSDALSGYERALDQLAHDLAERSGSGGTSRANGEPSVGTAGSCAEGDPGCGLDDKPLF